MHKQLSHILTLFLFTYILFSTQRVGLAENERGEKQNPFTPKAFVIRYWDRAIRNNLPKPPFILSKVSPLSAADAAAFAKLAATNTLYTRLPEFCSAAHLLCFPDVTPSLAKHSKDADFAVYSQNENFTSYGTSKTDGVDSFKNYSNGFLSSSVNEFQQYSRKSAGHDDRFTVYAEGTNAANPIFNSYGTSAAGGSGEFLEYGKGTNVPNLEFSTYSSSTAGRKQTFTSYSEEGNAGNQTFANYGKASTGAVNGFTTYGTAANVFLTDFSNYAEKGTSANDTFTNYGVRLNDPRNNFKNYGEGSFGSTESFSNYRVKGDAGDDTFSSYGKGSRAGIHVGFNSYGKSFFQGLGTDNFKGYDKGADPDHKVTFKTYRDPNTTFKDYAKSGVSFSSYTKPSSISMVKKSAHVQVQSGKFFREMMLKEGTVMPMPDIRDKLPQRSFLPYSILTKLPFASSKINDLKRVFGVSDSSFMEKMIVDSLRDCERAPSRGETKQCVGSLEDMIDFATSVLGRDVTVRSTENVNGSNKNVVVGRVKGVSGGKVTQSVSCHQSLFPYLLYYCHSVPKVRVYEADLFDQESKAKINHGVAICHLDTSDWSPTHGAFLSLGSGPGQIEVCHWIFENDMTWTTTN